MPVEEKEGPYKQISLEDAVADPQAKHSLSALDKPWQPQKARLQMAGGLAVGLLILLGLIITCNGFVIVALVVAGAVAGKGNDPTVGSKQMIDFVTALLPYVATPLGVALGYFFKETQGE